MPEANLLGERGAGFVIAQDRLGPGRIHHCMRAIGTAERAIEMMCERANSRDSFGGPLADKQFVQDFIAKSRMEVDQARLLTLYAAWQMDTEGKRRARQAISMIKVVAANVVMDVLDRAIQVHGSLGMSDDTPLAGMWRFMRMLRVADGPDEVHKMVIARRELNRAGKRAEAPSRARHRDTPRSPAPTAPPSRRRPRASPSPRSRPAARGSRLRVRAPPGPPSGAPRSPRRASRRAGFDPLRGSPARPGQLDDGAAAVVGVRASLDQTVGLELADGLRHRLRPHPLGGRQIADARRSLAVEPAEDGAMEERKAMLGPQPADQLPEDDAQLARGQRGVGLGRHSQNRTRRTDR